MNWVIDCSFAAALFLPDEKSNKVSSFFSGLSTEDSLWIPSLWWYELTNVLAVAERRKRLCHEDVIKIIYLYDQFSILTDNIRIFSLCSHIYDLAKTNQLSAYDAAYLELAIRKDATLATLDKELLETATTSGIRTFTF
ncbi:MAG: hypothetical protein A2161_17440 [Candidatus Schekmanbacteria bacterium RBG_13_48_7]|uniref:PIN domain-containing protein n=1 Tax=Candidatus Schekmanbacteria bacterium RBG_13_48_7 TaxID=1817878 RepID=A0A1F7S462_9BACT|nr:MAG: hypothetical protein A2161_17440 [Candidatus Schekmanbacteria bacterium RBG_13_48_7]